ncbi:MAG TPA: glutamate 5-kinase [Acidimicrobiales bacterium]|nr:glutamate 5-kinase [Acidimicrobiales bacterium]
MAGSRHTGKPGASTAADQASARRRLAGRTVVVKVGSSSITDERGEVMDSPLSKLCSEVAGLRADGARVVVVTSGAMAAGLSALGLWPRPSDLGVLQAACAVGQVRLMARYEAALEAVGLVGGQILLAPLDFINRAQYLHARQTFQVLLGMGVVPVVNENDAVADDEIRFGDNDRLSALVAHLLQADLLVLLTDAQGLFTADPRVDTRASLVDEVLEIDQVLAMAGGPGTERGSGGMASKLAAAKIAAWSGVRVVIAGADRPGVLADAVVGSPGVGTVVRPRRRRLPARKLWIAFARASSGTVEVDAGAKKALTERGVSLLPAGVREVRGDFAPDDAVQLTGPDGRVFAKGLVRHSSQQLAKWAGWRTSELPSDVPAEVIHRDDLVILP